MEIEVFDVEHGACALVTAETGARLLIDCGHNSTTNWRPSLALPARGIGMVNALVVANYDEDHVSDFPNLMRTVYVPNLIRNPSVRPMDLLAMKTETGIGAGIGTLAYMAGSHYVSQTATAPNVGELEVSYYWNAYPAFIDENNLSLVTLIRSGNLCAIFPGDLELRGWQNLLRRPDFRVALTQVNVFVASHHGRESGYCLEVFDYCTPEIVIFSDQSIAYETQETARLYGRHALGVRFFDGTTRHVVTTRNNGYIRLCQRSGGAALIWISRR